jgi:hypothetical protein
MHIQILTCQNTGHEHTGTGTIFVHVGYNFVNGNQSRPSTHWLDLLVAKFGSPAKAYYFVSWNLSWRSKLSTKSGFSVPRFSLLTFIISTYNSTVSLKLKSEIHFIGTSIWLWWTHIHTWSLGRSFQANGGRNNWCSRRISRQAYKRINKAFYLTMEWG